MVELGFSLQPSYGCEQGRVMELLCEAGFSAVSPIWSDEPALDTLASYAAKHNIAIQSLHAPRGGVAPLWTPEDPLSGQVEQRITHCIDACARFQIPIMVMHGWQGVHYTFPGEPLDFSAFDRLVEHAEKSKVCIAFENLEGEEYLEALMTRYRELACVGFCWDSGHDNCYPHNLDFLARFGDRLVMTHLHDNLGLRDPGGVPSTKDDLHLLPFDGKISWEQALGRLKDMPKQKILNFELKKRAVTDVPGILDYDSLSPEEFFFLAGQRARQIADLYEIITDTKKA